MWSLKESLDWVIAGRYSELCSSLMGEHNLFSVNMELFCKGPIVTFQSYDGGSSTCIDHILIKESIDWVIAGRYSENIK
jgi:hypothetical protein